jgi:type VI secretion system protein ImpA
MATEPLIDFDTLVQPIPGDDPAGEPVPFAVRAEMEEARKEIHPEDFSPDDPLRPAEAKWADWAAVVRSATDTLTTTSKDLLVAARLTEALTKRHGFAGLADGLHLLLSHEADLIFRQGAGQPAVLEGGEPFDLRPPLSSWRHSACLRNPLRST